MFEFFFKYPRSVYARGQFALLGAWPKWILVLLIVAAAVGLALLIRSRLAQAAPVIQSWRAWVIWGLQALLAALILVLLWQPAITVSELKPQQNIIAVLVDDSRSMAITDADSPGLTRQAQAVKALQDGVLDKLNHSFQTRLYRVDAVPARVENLKDLQPGAASTRIGDSLKQLADETTDLPIGAVVLLSDGDDNSNGINADAINALRARHIPVHTVGFGREHAVHDVELEDAVIAPRALAESRIAAKITLRQRGYAGAKLNLTVRDVSGGQPKVLASRPVTLGADGNLQTETLMFDIGGAGAKTLQIAATALAGEENNANNTLTRVVNVGSEPRHVLYIEGEPRWEYKFIRQAEEDDRMVQIVSIVRTSENKIYRQGVTDPAKELVNGFPSTAEELFSYDGIIIGSVEAGYFTPIQQQLIHDFVDRRGGGLLLLGGQFSLADGGWAASNVITDLLPTTLPTQPGTFHREQDPRNGQTHTTAELAPDGFDSIITRVVDDRDANAAKWKKLPYLMDYEDPGTAKYGAQILANMITPEGKKLPLLITENFGHGRTAIMAGGTWRWQMSLPLGDTAHDLFWQQLLRWLSSDTPGHVAASVPAQMLLDNGAVTITADVRDQQYNPAPDAKVEAHVLGPSGVSALVEMAPVPDTPGQFQAAWSASKPGAYLTEVTARRAGKELGRDVLTFQRMDGVAENFHTEQNRELLERLATQTGGQYWKPADLGKLAAAIPFSEAGVTMRETKDLWDLPLVFVILLLLRFSEWWLRRKWGIV